MNMRILVISDTHIPARTGDLPRAVLQAAESDPDLIIHAGDLVEEQVLHVLEECAPVHAVAGNMDPPALTQQLPRRREIDAGGVKIGVMHGDSLPAPRSADDGERAAEFPEADVVVTGHTHIPRLTSVNGVWVLNPGSPTDPRGGSVRTFAWMEMEDGELSFTVRAF